MGFLKRLRQSILLLIVTSLAFSSCQSAAPAAAGSGAADAATSPGLDTGALDSVLNLTDSMAYPSGYDAVCKLGILGAKRTNNSGFTLNPLLLRSPGRSAQFISSAELSCQQLHSSKYYSTGVGTLPPRVRVYINETYLGKFAANFTGVELVSQLGACIESFDTTTDMNPVVAFCRNQTIVLDDPMIRNVTLPIPHDYKAGEWLSMLLMLGSDTYVHNGGFRRNKAGSPIVVIGTAAVTLFNTSIVLNEGAVAGGAVRVMDVASLVTLGETNILYNTAGMGGGIVALEYNNVTLGGATYCVGNTALKMGGCMHVGGSVIVTIGPEVHIEENTAPAGGGLTVISNASVDIYGFVVNNTATGAQQTDYYTGTAVQFSGGAMYVAGNATVVWESGSVCALNSADQYGGCVNSDSNSIVSFLPGSLCMGNKAGLQGGCVTVYDDARLYLRGLVVENDAKESGGGFSAAYTSHVELYGCLVINTARVGAGGFIADSATLLVAGCAHIMGNDASKDSGGGLALSSNKGFVVKDCAYFAHNTAGNPGGAMYIASSGSQTIINGSSSADECQQLCRTQVADCAFGIRPSKEEIQANKLQLSQNHTGIVVEDNSGSIGGGIWVSDGTFTMVNTLVTNNTAGTAGGVCAQAGLLNLAAAIVNSSIVNNVASWGGGIWVTENATVTLSGSTVVSHNVAKSEIILRAGGASRGEGSGGGIAVTTGTVILRGTAAVHHNTAALYGGGISGEVGAVVALYDSARIQQNAAKRGGGVAFLKWGGQFNTFNNSLVTDNTAEIADNMYLPPQRIALQLPNGASNGSIYNVTSRIPRDEGLMPVIVTVTGYSGLPAAGAYLRVSVGGNELLGGLKKTNESGIADFYDLKLRASPGIYKVTFETLDIYESAPPVYLEVSVRQCIPGEVTLGYPDACEPCLPGSYSLNPDNITCDTCPEGAVCAGGTQVWPQPGWWHSSALSPQLHKCPNPEACIGATVNPLCLAATSTHSASPGNSSASSGNSECYNASKLQFTNPSGSAKLTNITSIGANQLQGQEAGNDSSQLELCVPGYSGNLCGECQPEWGSTAVFECRKCYPAATVIGVYSLICLAMLLVVRVMSYFTLLENTQPASAGDSVRAADICKSVVLWFQWLSVVASIRVDWPPALRYPFTVLQWLWASPSTQTLSLDCALNQSNHYIPLAAQRIAVYLGVPIATYLVLIAAASVMRLLHNCGLVVFLKRKLSKAPAGGGAHHRRRALPPFSHVCMTYLLVAIFVFLPSLSRTVFSLFVCVAVDNPKFVPYAWTARANGTFWASDMSQQCWSDAHKRLAYGLGIPCMLLLCIVLPLSILLLLTFNRRNLQAPRFRSIYGFLYSNYRPGWCALTWEAIIICQTNIIAAISVFGLSLGSLYQATVMNAALALFLFLLMLLRPYLSPELQTVRLVGVAALLFTSYTSITFTSAGAMENPPPSAYGTAMSVVLLVTNAAYVVLCVVVVAKTIHWHLVPSRVLKLWAWIQRACGCGRSSSSSNSRDDKDLSKIKPTLPAEEA